MAIDLAVTKVCLMVAVKADTMVLNLVYLLVAMTDELSADLTVACLVEN